MQEFPTISFLLLLIPISAIFITAFIAIKYWYKEPKEKEKLLHK